jgi:hypothetical protein
VYSALFDGNDNWPSSICVLERQEGIGNALKHLRVANPTNHFPSNTTRLLCNTPSTSVQDRFARGVGLARHARIKPVRGPLDAPGLARAVAAGAP